jgi:hypothetical protein
MSDDLTEAPHAPDEEPNGPAPTALTVTPGYRVIDDYRILWSTEGIEEFELRVAASIGGGWEPLGGLTVAFWGNSGDRCLYQSMVHYRKRRQMT